MKQRICFLYAGGTIGMQPTAHGLAPVPGVMNAALAPLLPADIDWTLAEYDPLIDSSNATPADWLRLARDIDTRRDAADGFVVLHGTDTLAHTASALACLLAGLGKPVAVTGSMRPLFEAGSDAPANIRLAVSAVRQAGLCEVVVPFAGRVWRGCRVRKAHSLADAAFVAPNDLPLFDAGGWHPERFAAPSGVRRIVPESLPAVALVWLAPGATLDAAVATLALPHLAGAVLAGYGAGNVPDALAPHLLAAAGRGVVLATVTQAWQGAVAMGAYAASQALVAAGVVPLADMTPEAALARLTVLLATETDPQRVRQQLAGGRPGEWSNAPA
ncbi:asparaginase [Laribacter hongkongensis]|uniref:asparaginase n=1 Tax=Laribacter hongkongensis TaxID=168471 RepID=UPI001EFDA8A2|nr:asparaginase [Laribacter hongkongensis]MCG9097376.1 asparaginase [Laribacter hongkongensis]